MTDLEDYTTKLPYETHRHFLVEIDGVERWACYPDHGGSPLFESKNVNYVTCNNCKRTKTYKNALDIS